MTRACWRTMACVLVAGLGGLVVWAADAPPNPAPVPKLAPPVVTAVPPPTIVTAAVPPTPVPEPTPQVTLVADPPPPPAAPVPVEPPPSPPAPVPDPTPPAPAPMPPPLPPAYATVPPPATPMPPLPDAPPMPVTPQLAPPPPPADVAPVAHTAPAPTPPPPPPPPVPTPPLTAGLPASPPPAATPFPWKLSLEVVNGLTQLEMRHGDELLMRVQCDKLDLHTPAGGLQATGRVAVTGPCVEARCERLTIAWTTGQVALDGAVRLAFQNKGAIHEMRAEAVCFRLNGANQPVDFTAGDVHKIVAPAQ